MTRQEALAEAHREAARAIRDRIESRAGGGFAKDWNTSEDIRTTIEELELLHVRAAERLTASTCRALA